jgi:hypothetical protein
MSILRDPRDVLGPFEIDPPDELVRRDEEGLRNLGLGLPAESGLAAMLLARLSLVLTTAVGMTLLIRPRPVVPEAEMTTSR